MATPNVGILTNAGKNLIDQVNAGQTKITFSKIVFSSMNNNQLTDDQIKALTAITPQEIVVNNPEVTLDKNTGETRIRATGNNETLTDGVYVKTYAVFAKDDLGNEILYGITVSPNPNYLPEYDGVTPQAVTYSYKVNISNTSNITFTNSNDVYISDTDLAEALQPYAKTVDVNQQLDKKVNVSDMRKPASDVAGIDEVSTLQTQVDNSAVGINLAFGTDQEYTMGFGIPDTVWQDGYAYEKLPITTPVGGEILPQGTHTFYYTLTKGTTYTQTIWFETDAKLINGSSAQFTWFTNAGHDYQPATLVNLDENKYKIYSTYTWPGKSDNSVRLFDACQLNSAFDFSTGTYLKFGKSKLEKGSLSTDWCPNPDDKVNVFDMRKPASDVAGIEEVNAKQDKIGYTPADDSKVVHTSDTSNWQKQKITNDDGSIIKRLTVSNGDDLNNYLGNLVGGYTTFYVQSGVTHNPSTQSARGFILKEAAGNGGANYGMGYLVDNIGNVWSIVVTASTTPIYTLLSNDSKVAHLSGANNFDTTPTVNNNPLLLASSLPSDLARTGSDQEFTGKNTFDTAPIDKTTGHPYITKDGVPAVPSTLADTTKPANFTAGLQSGGVSVATSDDLKSVEESAWRELDLSGTSGIYQGKILIKIDQANKYIYFMMNAQVPLKSYSKGTKIIDLSSVVTGLSAAHGYLQAWIDDLENPYQLVGSTISTSGTCLTLGSDNSADSISRIATEADPGKQYCYVTYDSLVNN